MMEKYRHFQTAEWNRLIDRGRVQDQTGSEFLEGEWIEVRHRVIGINTNPYVPHLNGVYTRDDTGNIRQHHMDIREMANFFGKNRRTYEPVIFEDPVFFGGGPSCEPLVDEAQRQMDEAFEMNSGLQQPMMSTEEDANGFHDDYQKGCAERDKLIRSVVIAMGGKGLLK